MPIARPIRHLALNALAATAALALTASPAQAQGGGWGGHPGHGWDDASPSDRWGPPPSSEDMREGRVQTERFPAPDSAPLLGHGIITVRTQPPEGNRDDAPPANLPRPGAPPIAPDNTPPATLPDRDLHQGPEAIAPRDGAPRDEPVFEAAVIDQLARAGYDTASPASTARGTSTQLAELRITHAVLVPAEQRRSPFSGEMAMGASNHGSMLGLGLNIDLSKPRAALISTTLTLRIRDAASGRPLWEGRASIATREGSSRWSNQTIATRLAAALFEGFAANPGAPSGR